MFAAFVAPKDDVCFQEEGSDDWNTVNSIMKHIPLRDANKYKTEFSKLIEFFHALNAAIFKKWEDEH